MKQVELVFIPATALSHIMAAVATAELLLRRAERRLSATVIIMNPAKDTAVEAYYAEKISPSSNPHLRFIKLPSPEGPPNPSITFILEYIESRAPEVRQIISDLIEKGSTVAGVVLDLFTTNFIDVADEFGIASYVFNPTGAGNLAMYFHPDSTEESGSGGAGSEMKVPYFSVPVPAKMLPGRSFRDPHIKEIAMRFFRRLSEVKGIMSNTFYELEPYAIDALTLTLDGKGPKIYAVGPVLNTSGGGGGGDDEVTRWLDEQPEKSVVFLCFGSMGSLVGEQVREIALALENGGFRFLWSLRGGAATAELPEGFSERKGGVGRVIGWAAQAAVLAHAAVGCFVSHCGWNSTLESVWFGVQIAAFPLFAEQHLNAFELVEELKMAEAITLDYLMDFAGKTAPEIVGAEKIEAAIWRAMAAEGGGVRGKVEEMKKAAKRALMEGGSSYNAQTLFIQDVLRLLCCTCTSSLFTDDLSSKLLVTKLNLQPFEQTCAYIFIALLKRHRLVCSSHAIYFYLLSLLP